VDFDFSDDQEMLRASVRQFLAARAPIAPYVRAHYDAEVVRADDVWIGLAELGVVGLLVPDAFGGADGGMVDAAVVLEELGRAVCPVPYAASAIGAVSLVLALGSEREHSFLLPGLADGSVIGTLALLEPGTRYRWDAPATVAHADGDGDGAGNRGWRIDGTKVHVADGAGADLLLVTAFDGGGRLGVFAVQGGDAGVATEPSPTVDGSRKVATVTFNRARGWRLDDGEADAAVAVARTVDRLGVAAVVDGVGAAARALELSVEYAKERVQFDKPIGTFQAVQHLCADMLRTVELGRAAGYYACWAADDAPAEEAHRAATVATAFASRAFPALGATAIQVFGGIGFTWEHDIHLFYKRLLSAAQTLGTADDHLAELATLAIDE
jgi:alkylation response protein AidB-like acyl-CoA dehydrogenase